MLTKLAHDLQSLIVLLLWPGQYSSELEWLLAVLPHAPYQVFLKNAF